jgi:hypothetical protein
MRASAYLLAALAFGAVAIQAAAQQDTPPAAAVQPSAPAGLQPPASVGVHSAAGTAPLEAAPGPAAETVDAPKRLGTPLPTPPPAQLRQRLPPQVYVSVVSPQDSRFAKRLRAGAEEQRLQRARGSGISGLSESGARNGARFGSQSAFGSPSE